MLLRGLGDDAVGEMLAVKTQGPELGFPALYVYTLIKTKNMGSERKREIETIDMVKYKECPDKFQLIFNM